MNIITKSKFEKWFEENKIRFHQGCYTDKQIAFAAWIAAMESLTKEINSNSF